MRDAFLSVLLALGAALIVAAVWLLVESERRDDGGCGTMLLVVGLGGAGVTLLIAVAHAAGVTASSLGW